MTYLGERVAHDADAHIMEPPDWLRTYADPGWRSRMPLMWNELVDDHGQSEVDRCTLRHHDADYRAEDAAQIMLRKNYAATGSFLAHDRPSAVDLIGVQSQLMFNTFASGLLTATEAKDPVLAEAMARAHNRGITEFCSVDHRLLPVCYVPLATFQGASTIAAEAIESGAAALMVASACPAGHSPSHTELFPVWAQAQDAGVPIVMHVGGGGQLLSPKYFDNGLAPVPDFHGGAENFRSIDYLAIPGPLMQTLSTLIIDGIFDRFPRLMFGAIEQGASWLPGWLRNMDSAFGAFRKNEERLQHLSAPPSDIARRQLKVTPYPHEDTGWIIANAGAEMCLFSSDYPHVEGGRNPLARFDTSLGDLDESSRQRFYFDNFVELMGPVLERAGLPTEVSQVSVAA